MVGYSDVERQGEAKYRVIAYPGDRGSRQTVECSRGCFNSLFIKQQADMPLFVAHADLFSDLGRTAFISTGRCLWLWMLSGVIRQSRLTAVKG